MLSEAPLRLLPQREVTDTRLGSIHIRIGTIGRGRQVPTWACRRTDVRTKGGRRTAQGAPARW
jgi:hypothetical protein